MTEGRAGLEVSAVSKSFGDAVVLDGLNLTVEPGEVMVLLGPSGCGKSTLLRLVAGLDRPDSGEIRLGGRVVCGAGVMVAPEQRRVGLVFQNGALFPHLSVARNVGYGLERAERRGGQRVDEMLELVGLAGLGDRAPDTLSGGQQQRVALARALAPTPAVLLMDEPFSNLDAVLRERLRRDVASIVRAAGVTTVFVTHDRDEAFAVADRVAVMRSAEVAQVDTPERLYRRPVDDWVAAFVGDTTSFGGEPGVVRPEELELVAESSLGTRPAGARAGTVSTVEFLGATVLVSVQLDDGSAVSVRSLAPSSPVTPGDRVVVGRRA